MPVNWPRHDESAGNFKCSWVVDQRRNQRHVDTWRGDNNDATVVR